MKIRSSFTAFIVLAASTVAYAFFGLGGTSWKEEVLLHDGSKIVVERTISHGGKRELTQRSPIKEHEITFTMPGTKKTLTWKDEYDETIGFASFNLVALHILSGTPYIIAEPNSCLPYNKWGRPNPPYVIFKHDGNTWQRIQITELPKEFETINLVVYAGSIETKVTPQSTLSAGAISKLNSSLPPYKQYKSILREPIKITCDELIYYKGAWLGPGDKIGKELRDRK